MDTIFVLDVSASMAGESLREMIRAVTAYIEFSARIDMSERIAIVTFGQETRVRCSLTTDYSRVKSVVSNLSAGGSTPMGEGLALAFKEFVESGRIFKIGSVIILPRIILLTDGEPNDYEETLKVAYSLGQLSFPISAMGVTSCNEVKMKSIAIASGGTFMMVHQIDKLVDQFLTQLMLILFILEMRDRIEQLFNKVALKQYLEEKLGRSVSESELEEFILFLKSIVRIQEGEENNTNTNRQQQRSIQGQQSRTNNSYTNTNNNSGQSFNVKFTVNVSGPYHNAILYENSTFKEAQKVARSVLGFEPNELCLNGCCFNSVSGNKTVGEVLPLYEGAIIVVTQPARDGCLLE